MTSHEDISIEKKAQSILADSLAELNLQALTSIDLQGELRWHYGTLQSLGYFENGGGREVAILWDEGGASRKQGDIPDTQWEIFKLAYSGGGRIILISDMEAPDWKSDYRMIEAQK